MTDSNEPTDGTDVTRREVLRKSATATGAVALGAVTASGSAAAWKTCARTPGYWKNHPDEWPVEELTIGNADLGTTTYSKGELLDILNAPPRGDVTIIMATHLIAAKLNLANGTEPGWDCVEHAEAHADIWLSVYPIGSGQHEWESTGETGGDTTNDPEKYKDELDDYNNGERCACGDD